MVRKSIWLKPYSSGLLGLLCLVACTTAPEPSLAPGTSPVEKRLQIDTLPEMAGQVSATPAGDNLRFQLILPQAAFQTKTLDLAQFQYLRIWVRGPGIPDQMWNKEGFAKVAGPGNSILSISGIPKGRNRIATAQAYDSQKQPIPGALLQAVYSSPPDNENVSVRLAWRFVPAAKILEQLLDTAPALAENIDAPQLQKVMDAILYGGKAPEGNPFAVHPTQIDPQPLAATIRQNNGNLPNPAELPAAWLPKVAAAALTLKTPQGGAFGSPVTLEIDDPASTAVILPPGATQATIPNIAPGTWKIRAKMTGLAGSVQGNALITVSPEGSLSLSKGTLADPLILPPLISAVTPNPGPGPQTVTITGDSFNAIPAANTVLFGALPGTVTAASSTSLTVTAPAGAFGTVPVSVNTGNQASNSVQVAVRPSITSLSTLLDSVGRNITVTGTSFDPANTVVRFNGTLAAVPAASTTSLTVTVPAGATTGPVTVETSAGIATSAPFTLGMRWTQATAAAAFPARTAHTSLAFNNKLWVIGGDVTVVPTCINCATNDVWSSSDGINWTANQTRNAALNTSNGANNPPANPQFSLRRDHASTVFNNKMWVIGGYNYATRLNDVWSSADGTTWNLVRPHDCCGGAPNIPRSATHFGRRQNASALAFNNKLWLLGGFDDNGQSYSDVWSSPDGITWTQETALAGFGQRHAHASLVFNNRMWVIGGNLDGTGAKNDVWSSADGIAWTQETGAAAFSARNSLGAVVFNNKMWILGGSGPRDDVWSSANGIAWTQETLIAPSFSARQGPGAAVLNGKIWLMSGWTGATTNDVWYSPE